MRKLLSILFLMIFASAFLANYLILSEKIFLGEKQIIDGQKELDDGKKMLAAGKAKLHSGKRRMSFANSIYNGVNKIPFMGLAHRLPVTGTVLNTASQPIIEGRQLIAQGEAKIAHGEAQLKTGEQRLQIGKEQLGKANKIRIASGIGAIILFLFAIGLGYYWRKSLAIFFARMHR